MKTVEADIELDASWVLLEPEVGTTAGLLIDGTVAKTADDVGTIVNAGPVTLVDPPVIVRGLMLGLVLELRVGTAISVACKQSGGEDVNSMKTSSAEPSHKRACPFPSVKAGLLHARVSLSFHILLSVGRLHKWQLQYR